MASRWNLDGTYFEACNCEAACPCVFTSPPTEGECTAVVGWHINKGSFGDVKLDGLNLVLAVHAPGHMLQVKWKAALYLDERATQVQKDALVQIFSGQAGGHPAALATFVGEILGVQSVAIDYSAEGKQRSLRIPNLAEVEIEALAGQGGAEVTVSNHPVCVAPGYSAVVAKSKRLSYHDHGFQLEVSGKNGYYSPFSYQGP
ncbi:MAG: DUF1326 domain-containing protein [Deltaproteobacteria bacterium]|nr:DUF1326 domain-containing protein [Deltaproteobacteria bacterium]